MSSTSCGPLDLGADLLYVKPIDPFMVAADLHRFLGVAPELAESENG